MSSLRGIERMEFPLSVRKKAFVRCCRDGVPHCEGCGIEINARTGISYEHVIPAGLGGEPTLAINRTRQWNLTADRHGYHVRDKITPSGKPE